MDHFPPAFPVWLAAALAAWLVLGAGVYSLLIRFVIKGGAKVSSREFGPPDIMLCVGLMVWFATAIKMGFSAPDHDVNQFELLQGAILLLSIVAIIGIYLHYRGINPIRQFGLNRLNPLTCGSLAMGLLLAAYPMILLVGKMTDLALNGKARPQNIVEYFMNASEDSDNTAVYLTMLMAVVIAPLVEETIFRGYIYGVLKHYLGAVAAALISAGMFAAMHLNLSSLPSLFVLALCLTLAYEVTGSLLVNIFMHGLFNLSMLLVIMKAAQHSASP